MDWSVLDCHIVKQTDEIQAGCSVPNYLKVKKCDEIWVALCLTTVRLSNLMRYMGCPILDSTIK